MLALFAVCFFDYTADYFRARSLFLALPSKVIPFNYFGIILGIIYDVAIFGHTSDWIQIVGMFLTSIGLLSNVILSIVLKET